MRIRYRFVLPDGSHERFDLFFDSNTFRLLNPHPPELPFWTELAFHQCENCPLKPAESPRCPVAVQLVGVIARLEKVVSYDQVRVDVRTTERLVSQETTAQQALSSLLGLIMAASDCPHTTFLRPMARFHLPLSSEPETIYRAAAAYALAELLRVNGSAPLDVDATFNGLKDAYAQLHKVNRGIARRIGAATPHDPARNAIVLLDAYTTLLPEALDQSLAEMRPLFAPKPSPSAT